MSELKNPELMAVAQDALRVAREFFWIGAEWQITLEETAYISGGAAAKCQQWPDYMRAIISYNPALHIGQPAQLWATIGHEVAHLVTTEFGLFENAYQAQHGDWPGALRTLHTHALERLVSRLERLFAQERPYVALEPS